MTIKAQHAHTNMPSNDHIVNVSAKDNATGKSQSMAIASLSRLSDTDIEKMVADREQHGLQVRVTYGTGTG